jgi:hypothetical protein
VADFLVRNCVLEYPLDNSRQLLPGSVERDVLRYSVESIHLGNSVQEVDADAALQNITVKHGKRLRVTSGDKVKCKLELSPGL